MAETKKTVDILRVEGIMAQGYGLNPKIVMRDKRLTTTAKAIYAYIASFAGGGNQAFPNRDLMIEELQINKNTYYKHMKILTDTDYIKIERTKGQNGSFDKNIYTIVALPNPVGKSNELEDSLSNKNSNSAGKESTTKTKPVKVKDRASVKALRERLQIDMLKEKHPEDKELIEEVVLAIEDMNSSEQINIGGTIRKKDAIQELLNRLTSDNILLVTTTMKNNKKTLLNRKSYIQACLVNSIFDILAQNKEAEGLLKKKSAEEAEKLVDIQKEQEKRKLEDAYAACPELKNIDNELTEIIKKKSRAVLSKNEVMIKLLEKQYEDLITTREQLVIKNSLDIVMTL
ncbi:MAG: helix-turn-helix domain-containing protein [Aminipila sp.]